VAAPGLRKCRAHEQLIEVLIGREASQSVFEVNASIDVKTPERGNVMLSSVSTEKRAKVSPRRKLSAGTTEGSPTRSSVSPAPVRSPTRTSPQLRSSRPPPISNRPWRFLTSAMSVPVS
jgi:hypothetical protein